MAESSPSSSICCSPTSFKDVPLLLGCNADEATPYAPFATMLAGYNTAANAGFGAMADRSRQVYPVSSDADVLASTWIGTNPWSGDPAP